MALIRFLLADPAELRPRDYFKPSLVNLLSTTDTIAIRPILYSGKGCCNVVATSQQILPQRRRRRAPSNAPFRTAI